MADQPTTSPSPEPVSGSAPSSTEAALNAAAETAADLSRLAAQAAAPATTVTVPAAISLPSFDAAATPRPSRAIELLSDVNLNVKIELGRTRMLVEDVLKLAEGAVVELDKLAGDPVDVYVNERHVARGEVLVLNDNFCVRINEILTPAADDVRAAA
ncbi:MAG: flagellar motor switch protein FliN [Phycisphaerae bacterium]|nr:flagellar motor switch protein FliN [Phycisphaerae bacterium]